MKNICDAFFRAAIATVIWGILTYPLLKVGRYFDTDRLYSFLAFFIPVFISMVIYNFTIDRLRKEF
jgi:hypothetical protein